MRPATPSLSLASIAWLAGLLPLLGVLGSWLLASAAELVPWCFPFTEGCTSISRTGRSGAAYYLFKATLIPAAAFMLLYWRLMGAWLQTLGDNSRLVQRAAMLLGIGAALFLVLYAVFLGAIGEQYQLARRIGVSLYFSLTCVAQLLVLSRLYALRRVAALPFPAWLYRGQYCCCLAQWGIGLGSLAVSLWVQDKDAIENILEWNFALAMILFFILSAPAWRYSGFQAALSTRIAAASPS